MTVGRLGPEGLVRGVSGLASLPAVYLRITAVVNDPRSSSDDVAEVIAEDIGLTARLLRLVNSSLFGFRTRIETVSQAIRVVGTSQVQDLALATSVIRTFRDVRQELVTMETFWRHSLACAIVARALAVRRRVPNVERFFVAGLLHDVGRLLVYSKCPEAAGAALLRARSEGRLLHDVEREVLGFDHAEVGRALLRSWGLPQVLQEAVGFHHAPGEAGLAPEEAAVVHLADVCANALELGTSGERLVPPVSEAAWDLLAFPAELLPGLLGEVEGQTAEAVGAIMGS